MKRARRVAARIGAGGVARLGNRIHYCPHRAPCHHQFWLQRTRVSLC